jgi:hypothetical protein
MAQAFVYDVYKMPMLFVFDANYGIMGDLI